MGSSISSNTIDAMVKNSINVINNYQQTCTVSPTQQATVSFKGCKIGKDANIDLSNQQIIKQDCILNATTKTAITSSVNQAMRQQAEAVIQNFAFGTVAAANNFIKSSVTLADEISNTYLTICTAKAAQSITFNCENSEIDGVITVTNAQNNTQSCILNAMTTSQAYQDTINNFSESAVAKQQSTFAFILLAFVLILAIGAWFVIALAEDPLVQWAIVGIVLFTVITSIVYALTAKSNGNYPYTKSN